MSKGQTKEQALAIAQQITERMQTDAEFTRQLVNDPKATLLSAGLSDEVIHDVTGPGTQDQDDVVGHTICRTTVEDYGVGSGGGAGCAVTCISTQSCFLSINVCCNTNAC